MASSYQTLANVFSDVRYLSGKDSTTLEDADLLRIANKYYLLMVRELVDLNEDLYAEISYTDLVSGQREYLLPYDDTAGTAANLQYYGGGLIKLQRVEVTYDGSEWKVADPISFQEIERATITDVDLNQQFDKSDPKYWFKDRSLWIAPVPGSGDSVAAGNHGLYIFWVRRPGEMTATSAIPDLPKDFLSVLVEGMLIDVYRKYGRTADARVAQANWETGIENMREKEANIDFEQQYIFKPKFKDYK